MRTAKGRFRITAWDEKPLSDDPDSASFVGLERVSGRIGSRSGTFVLQRIGGFEDGVAKESYSVVPGSATGDLQGLTGEGSSAVGHGMEHPFMLSYEFA